MSEVTQNQKIKLINRLAEVGITNEKKLNELTVENLLEIKGITVADIRNIIELKRQIKAGKLYSYLVGESVEGSEKQ